MAFLRRAPFGLAAQSFIDLPAYTITHRPSVPGSASTIMFSTPLHPVGTCGVQRADAETSSHICCASPCPPPAAHALIAPCRKAKGIELMPVVSGCASTTLCSMQFAFTAQHDYNGGFGFWNRFGPLDVMLGIPALFLVWRIVCGVNSLWPVHESVRKVEPGRRNVTRLGGWLQRERHACGCRYWSASARGSGTAHRCWNAPTP